MPQSLARCPPTNAARTPTHFFRVVLRTARSITALPNGILMELEATADALRHISDVIDRERRCCPFLRFQLDVPPNGEAYVMSVTGPDGTADLLAEFALIGLSTGVTEVRIDRTETPQ